MIIFVAHFLPDGLILQYLHSLKQKLMKRNFLALFLLFPTFWIFGQSRPTGEWIDFGSDHINKWLQIAPAKLGPNALPVPAMDFARLDSSSNIEAGLHAHVMEGDNALNTYLSFYWAVVPKRVVVQIWGNPTETFQTDNSVRDERQIYYDDTGWITQVGDLWISTYVQLVKGKKRWPDIGINYSHKTTTGGAVQGRYTEGGAEYYYIAFGKSLFPKNGFINEVRLALMGGFYVWQTNKVEMAQDDGGLFEFGFSLKSKNISWQNEIGGFNAYDAYRYMNVRGNNDPLVIRSNIIRSGKKFDYKLEYQTGLHDYHYNTFRFSVFYNFDGEIKL